MTQTKSELEIVGKKCFSKNKYMCLKAMIRKKQKPYLIFLTLAIFHRQQPICSPKRRCQIVGNK